MADWIEAATRTADIEPGITGGWEEVATRTADIEPGITGGWEEVATKTAIIKPSGEPPPPACTVDADCPTGYECIKGKCVKIKPEPDGEIPWPWIAAGAVGVGGILLLTGGKKPVGKKKS